MRPEGVPIKYEVLRHFSDLAYANVGHASVSIIDTYGYNELFHSLRLLLEEPAYFCQ